MFPVVLFHINWFLAKYSDLKMMDFPLCSRRHREKFFKGNSVLMLKASKVFQQFICGVWVNRM